MPGKTTATAKKRTETKPRSRNAVDQAELSKHLLTPDQFEAITKANYYHPESRLVLRLFLEINNFWHISRKMQGKPTHLRKPVDWAGIEESATAVIRETLSKLLHGVSVTPWEPDGSRCKK